MNLARTNLKLFVAAVFVLLALSPVVSSEAQETSVLGVDRNGLPPRTLPTGPPSCSTAPWVQTDLRIAHLPPADWRQIAEYGKAGYQVIAVNTLE